MPNKYIYQFRIIFNSVNNHNFKLKSKPPKSERTHKQAPKHSKQKSIENSRIAKQSIIFLIIQQNIGVDENYDDRLLLKIRSNSRGDTHSRKSSKSDIGMEFLSHVSKNKIKKNKVLF